MKIKEYWEIIKEAWKDSRKRALIKLGLYFIFFIIVIAMIRVNNSAPIINNKEEQVTYNNYSFKLNYNGNELLNGIYDEGVVKYIYQDQTYYLKDGMSYQMIDNNLVNVVTNHIRVNRLMIDILDSYIDESEELYKTEFKDGRIKKAYEIKIQDFAYLYDNKEITDENKINIIVTYLDEKIVEVEYDLTLYFNTYYNIQNNYVIKLEFNNFNSSEKPNLISNNNLNK